MYTRPKKYCQMLQLCVSRMRIRNGEKHSCNVENRPAWEACVTVENAARMITKKALSFMPTTTSFALTCVSVVLRTRRYISIAFEQKFHVFTYFFTLQITGWFLL
ncbi:hypothetical protein KIN20_020139 [Parelaphostrongylus tenuis]|uniref:Uncharacterized protein n=1 Tax=Parelaphostrongylus tenuis TaxID=148309 RepID=A0AAD5N3S4_PARTN|nr:hypothetical protein KIN20_020139 [Parelaphostrongylus tenuis]